MCSSPDVWGDKKCSRSDGKEVALNSIRTTSISKPKRVATAGEMLPDSMIELVADTSDPSKLKLLRWDGTNAKIAPRINYGHRTYEPVALDPTVVCGVRWPTRRSDCGRTRDLFDRIFRLVTENTGIAGQPAQLLVYFILSTWFPDRLMVAPGLAIMGSAVAQAIQLLRFLQCACRRSMLLVGMPQLDLMSLPLSLYPSLLIDRPTLTRSLRGFLSASNRRGMVSVRRGKLLGVCCPKAVFFGVGEVPQAVACSMLHIALPPAAVLTPAMDDEQWNTISTELQNKLLAYRLANFTKIRVSQLPEVNLTDQTRELAVNLAACVVDDPELAAGVVPLLRQRDEAVRAQSDRELETVIIEAILAVFHEKKKDRIQVKEIAALANAILRSRGEFIVYGPAEVGHRLDMLGLQRARSTAGMFLILTRDMRSVVHRLARTYDVPSAANVVSGCPDCEAASGPAPATV
jgi:hypothetical protein